MGHDINPGIARDLAEHISTLSPWMKFEWARLEKVISACERLWGERLKGPARSLKRRGR